MQYGIVATNKRVNTAIYSCFEYISKTDAVAFVNKFREQRLSSDLVMHTFRELIVGAYLGKAGRAVSYEAEHLGKKPDWSIYGQGGQLDTILELTNFHNARATESAMRKSLDAGELYCDWQPDPMQRLYQSIQMKVDKYESLAMTLSVPYVVAVYGDFFAAVEKDEVNEVLHDAYGSGIFAYSNAVSGILFFEESGGRYEFSYFGNPNPSTAHRTALPVGAFYPGRLG